MLVQRQVRRGDATPDDDRGVHPGEDPRVRPEEGFGARSHAAPAGRLLEQHDIGSVGSHLACGVRVPDVAVQRDDPQGFAASSRPSRSGQRTQETPRFLRERQEERQPENEHDRDRAVAPPSKAEGGEGETGGQPRPDREDGDRAQESDRPA